MSQSWLSSSSSSSSRGRIGRQRPGFHDGRIRATSLCSWKERWPQSSSSNNILKSHHSLRDCRHHYRHHQHHLKAPDRLTVVVMDSSLRIRSRWQQRTQASTTINWKLDLLDSLSSNCPGWQLRSVFNEENVVRQCCVVGKGRTGLGIQHDTRQPWLLWNVQRF